MASQRGPNSMIPLEPILFVEGDDEEMRAEKEVFLPLITGQQSPAEVAAAFDAVIVNEAKDRLEKYLKWREVQLQKDDPDQYDRNKSPIPPIIASHVYALFLIFAKLFIAYPPNSEGQNRLIQFLESLKELPRKNIMDKAHDGSIAKGDDLKLTELWPFESEDWGLGDSLTEVYREYFPYGDVGVKGSDAQLGWRNFSSALARINSLGFTVVLSLSSLGCIIPSETRYPDFKDRPVGGPNRVSADIIAADYWINDPELCRLIYKRCQKDRGEKSWTNFYCRESWDLWKKQFAFFIEDDRFWPEAKVVAKKALVSMAAVEKENSQD